MQESGGKYSRTVNHLRYFGYCLVRSEERFYLQTMKSLLSILLLTTSTFMYGQEYPQRTRGFWGMGAQAFGPVNIGLYSDVYLAPKIQSNFGLAFNLSYHLGVNYHFLKDPGLLSPYLGGQFVSIREANDENIWDTSSRARAYGFYIPLGLQYISPGGISLAADVGPSILGQRFDQRNTRRINGSVRVTYHFVD
jgi:hypothetical protein